MNDKTRAAIQQALEYLRDNQHYIADNERHAYVMEYNAFVERLEALADHVPDATKMIEQPAQQQEPVYAFRRKGQDSFCTCDKERYEELADKPNLFEVTTFYAAPQPITTPDVCGEVCARAKLCYGCNKDLEEANAKYVEKAEQEPVACMNRL